MIEIILCNAEYFDKMQNIPHFYFDDCQVFAVKRKKFIEKSCDKIWRGMKKSLPLHSLLRIYAFWSAVLKEKTKNLRKSLAV